jgi:hypothetical protein
MPGIVAGTEWAAYYAEQAAAFGLTIDATGPNFGLEPLLDRVADSPALATFVGEQTRLVWPADHELRRVAVHRPTPVYPHSLLWRRDNPHPALNALRGHLGPADPTRLTPRPGPRPGRGGRAHRRIRVRCRDRRTGRAADRGPGRCRSPGAGTGGIGMNGWDAGRIRDASSTILWNSARVAVRG